ncbi:hypothetical protein GCM10023187_37540 [Nibrella viscosa]|uniref:DUF4369 domain-containing protein n=1 Tax=Nibrella viscosa TaxID=1084524 RepID=A0ABP8KN73_9BACT
MMKKHMRPIASLVGLFLLLVGSGAQAQTLLAAVPTDSSEGGLRLLYYQDAGLTVIGNVKGVPVELKENQLRAVLRGERQRWSDGSKVIIALMKTNTNVGLDTGKKIFNMTAHELNKYWLALVFQGKADAPNFFNTETELESFVAQTQGAIGVLSQLSGAAKTVLVDGKRSL